jgi:integrase
MRGKLMIDADTRTAITAGSKSLALYNKTTKVTAIQKAELASSDYVPHINVGQIKLMATAAGQDKRHGERNALLIKFLFDSCLRISEALGVRPVDIQHTPDGWTVRVIGKGGKPGVVAISASIAAGLQAYCYRTGVDKEQRVFQLSRSQAFRVVSDAYQLAGIPWPARNRDHVGRVHILRHSGAIERLRLTGNPRATQSQLRHKSALMTLRYLKTISEDESLQIQQGVDFNW